MKRKGSEASDEKIVGTNGDIYTKVAMPRSKSFMKMNNNPIAGPQYNLQDLFKELKEQVGAIAYYSTFNLSFPLFSTVLPVLMICSDM